MPTRRRPESWGEAANRHNIQRPKREHYNPRRARDPKRIYGELEREILFFVQNKRCAQCGAAIKWGDAEVHHVIEHSKGGGTTVENGALVHPECHPTGAEATAAFAAKVMAVRQMELSSAPPDEAAEAA